MGVGKKREMLKVQNVGEENEQTEFKKSTGELKEGVISIVSILNLHESGVLYFGEKMTT
jgi:ATP-dependent DNA helicase RecG